MADHIITGADAGSIPFTALIAEEEYENSYWIVWTKPASQDTVSPSTDFIVKFNRPIDFNELTLDNFAIQRVTGYSPLAVTDVENPFEDIDSETDYNSISRELTLTLTSDLPSGAEFLFIVQDLMDTTGLVQTEPNVVLFMTSGTSTIYDSDQVEPDIDEVIIEDYTLVSPPVPLDSDIYSSLVECSIPDGTLNIATGTTTFSLYYSQLVDTGAISLTKENLESGESAAATIACEQNETTFEVVVTMPEVEENCLYTIDAIYGTFQFTGVLDPFYVPLGYLTPFTSSVTADPILWARIIFTMSQEVETQMGSSAEDYLLEKPLAVLNYTKYLVLSMFASPSTNDSFMLGELQITEGLVDTVDFKSMLKAWEDRLFGYYRNVVTFDPYYPRPGRYPHDVSRSGFDREWDTFDRRLD